ncbi:hypothetical protein J3U18_00190 [Gilliamella sp. B3482]|uniref:hypothetical protein n=1 Tax=Gilliamella sp. B3482 TaxID=2817991 RepID=UPI00226A066A|nr:hypothetical protein [Gilliamella sp. B3482]MCX8580112.1 hypothetical protein [Gilliamella sp. B3482]
MKIDDTVLNHKKVEFRYIEFGDVFSFGNEFYIKSNLDPYTLAFYRKKRDEINENNTKDFEYVVNIYDGSVTAFEQTTMVRPIKAKLTLDK